MTGREYALLFTAVFVIFLALIVRDRLRIARQIRARLAAQWGRKPDRTYEQGELTRIAWRFENTETDAFVIDDITAGDLDLDEVFERINYSCSSVGDEYLYRLLRTPAFDEETLAGRQQLAEACAEDRETVLRLQLKLSQIGRSRRLSVSSCLETLEDCPKPGLAIHLICVALLIFSAASFFFAPSQAVLFLVVSVIVSVVSYYREKGRTAPYFLCMQYIARLVSVSSKIAHEAAPQAFDGLFADIRRQCGKLSSIRRYAGVLRGGGLIGGNPLEVVADYLAMLFHVDLIAFCLLLSRLRAQREAAWQLFDDIGALECAISTALWRSSAGETVRPVFSGTEQAFMTAQGVRHPLLDNAVPNSIDAGRPVLLTGSNASGKSTFLRTLGVNAILAQTVGYVCAAQYRAPFARVMSSMALTDSLVGGESYFMVELRSLKRILDAADGGVLFAFVDEVLRGTNTVERIAASSRILKVLADAGVLVFAATHDIELTTLLEDVCDNYHFDETIEDGDVRFSYRLKPGRAVSRNAIELLRVFGYGEEIVEKSRKTAALFEETGIWRMT